MFGKLGVNFADCCTTEPNFELAKTAKIYNLQSLQTA